MEKKKGVNWSLIIIVILVLAVIVLAIIPPIGSKAAEDCLRGNNSACVYFEAQEEVGRIEQELRVAKEALATARAEYNQSK